MHPIFFRMTSVDGGDHMVCMDRVLVEVMPRVLPKLPARMMTGAVAATTAFALVPSATVTLPLNVNVPE